MLFIIQNDPEVPPGNIIEILNALGQTFTVVHPYLGEQLPTLRNIGAMIVLGGAMGANDDKRYPFLTALKCTIAGIVEQNIPYLGICLGGQLLAAACGAGVHSNRWEELGTSAVQLTPEGKNDLLFYGTKTDFPTFQWHHDSFDIPSGGRLLASSSACPHQAFRIGIRAWGTQFHPEVTEGIIRDWCSWDPATRIHTENHVARWKSVENDYFGVSRRMLESFLKASAS